MKSMQKSINTWLTLFMIVFSLLVFSQASADETSRQTPAERLIDAISKLAVQIGESFDPGRNYSVAVMPLTTIRGEQNDLGVYLAEKVASEMSFQYPRLNVLERTKITDALNEIQLGQSGIMSQETIQEAGNALGADAIIVGTIMELGEQADISVRIIMVSTLEIMGRASQLIPKDKVISELLGQVTQAVSSDGQEKKERQGTSAGGKYVYFDDFSDPGNANYYFEKGTPKHKLGKYSINPEVKQLKLTTGDNCDIRLVGTLERQITSGRITVEFLPLKIYPNSGIIRLLGVSSSGNGYYAVFPKSKYASQIGNILSGEYVVLQERKGDAFELGVPHTVVLEFTPDHVKSFLDGKPYYSVPNTHNIHIDSIKVWVMQLDCFINSIKVEEL